MENVIKWKASDRLTPPTIAYGYVGNILKLRIVSVMGKSVLIKESDKKHLFPPLDGQIADFETCLTAAELYKNKV